MRVFRAAVAGLVAALAVTLASAQSGGMKVRVYDAKDNSGVPGAVVVLSHATGNVAPYTIQTDLDGYANFPVLRAGGGYILNVSATGYAKITLKDQRVKVSENVVIPVGMAEAIQEKVEVVATRQAIDIENTTTSTKFSDEFLKDLPIAGRAYQNVLALAPGVTDDDGDGNPNVNGSRETDFKAVVSGVSNVDPFSGERLNYVNPDSIEEIEVITAGAGVELGRAQGGFAKIVQKQGTNQFEGTFGMLYRSSKLDGKGANNESPDRFFPAYKSYQPSITVSGPVKQDKLWYIVNYEYHNDETPETTSTGFVVDRRVQPIGSGTLTWQASPRNKLAFKYEYDPITETNLGLDENRLRSSQNLYRREVGGPVYSMRWSAPFSPKLLVESTVAYQDSHSNRLPMTDAAGPDGILGTADDNTANYGECVKGLAVLAGADCLNLKNGEQTGSYSVTHRDQRQRFTMGTDADIFGGKFWGMNHSFKLGFIVENERYYQFENNQPTSQFFVTQSQDRTNRVGVLLTTFSVPAISTARATDTTVGLYASDEMKPANNLTIKVGVRFDREATNGRGVLPINPDQEAAMLTQLTAPPPLGQNLPVAQVFRNVFTAYEDYPGFLTLLAGSFGISPELLGTSLSGIALQSTHWDNIRRPGDINLLHNNISPNLSISWDPWNDAKTKFAATYGKFYNNIPLAIPSLESQGASATVEVDTTTGGTCPAPPAPCPAFQIPSALNEVFHGGFNPAITVRMVDRDLRTPHTNEQSFKFERELTSETVFRMTYIRRHKMDDIQDIDINHAPGDFGSCILQTQRGGPTVQPLPRTPSNPTGGDGILDDCLGRTIFVPVTGGGGDGEGQNNNQTALARPDGIPDLYVLNPAWGSVLLVGNFNHSRYNAVTLELDRRLYRGWQLNGSYTWSRNIGQAEDFFQELGDDRSLTQDEEGPLAIDVTHNVKVNATTIVPWGFRLGGTISWQSGYPYSLLERRPSYDAVPPEYESLGVPDNPNGRLTYITHHRNDQRNAPYWVFNVHLAKEMNLKGGKNLELSADIFNLLNRPYTRIFDQVNGVTIAANDFGRRFQMGMKLAF